MNGLEVKACINKHASCVFSSHFLPSVHDNNNIFIYTEKTYQSGFSIRAGGRRNSSAISRQLAAYFENK